MKADAPPFDALNPANGICATVVTFYAALYPRLRQVAREQGYALALHGSLTRDLDVLAVPWVEDAKSEEELVAALVEASGGLTIGGRGAPADKPHGRRVWTIHLGGEGGFIDLSIMPRAQGAP